MFLVLSGNTFVVSFFCCFAQLFSFPVKTRPSNKVTFCFLFVSDFFFKTKQGTLLHTVIQSSIDRTILLHELPHTHAQISGQFGEAYRVQKGRHFYVRAVPVVRPSVCPSGFPPCQKFLLLQCHLFLPLPSHATSPTHGHGGYIQVADLPSPI